MKKTIFSLIKKEDFPIHFSCPGARYQDETELELPKIFQNNGNDEVYFFDIPTEFVVYNSKICTPRQGRFWRVDLYRYLDKIYLSSNGLLNRPFYDVKDFVKYEQAHVIERWENYGINGHIDYKLTGYVLVASFNDANNFYSFQKHFNQK